MSQAHELVFEEDPLTVRVVVGGETIAETTEARVLREGALPAVHYVPLKDVRTEFLEATDHTTTCPFKGNASYWSIIAGGKRVENAMWSYENPIESAAYLKGYCAFYKDRVDEYVVV